MKYLYLAFYVSLVYVAATVVILALPGVQAKLRDRKKK